MTTHNINKKRLVIRLSLVALLILLCFVLFYTGKEHEVLLDNKTATIGGREYQEIAYMNVVVDGDEEKTLEFYADDRDVVKLQGPSHTIKISVINEDTEEVIKTVERSLSLGVVSSVMYSLPAIVEGAAEAELPLPHLEQAEEDGGSAEEETPSEAVSAEEAPLLSD